MIEKVASREIAYQRFVDLGCYEVELVDLLTIDNDHPRLFGVGGIDKHFL